ncbi:hypothetical protein KI387_028649, partial [Taxus chinensis]
TYVSDSILFHLEKCDSPFKIWEKLEDLFGKVDHMRAMKLDIEITSLNPEDFPTIIDYLTKLKHLLTQLKGSGTYKKDEECVYLILSELRGPFQILASTFFSSKDALGDTFKMPNLETFCERLTMEESKLSHLESSTSQKALAAYNPKVKGKPNSKTKSTPYPSQNAPKPKENNSKPKESSQSKNNSSRSCSFCGGSNHEEHRCYKRMQALEDAVKKHKIYISTPPPSNQHGKALNVVRRSQSPLVDSWVIDSCASHHMTSSKESFVSLGLSSTSKIEVGDSSFIFVKGKGDIQLDGGIIQDALFVPNIATNFLSVYQICHSGQGKIMTFAPHGAE